MALFNFTRFEPPSIRQARLFETTRRLTGEVLSFTEQREDALRRFRQVEQQQNLQSPTFQPPTAEQRLTRQGRIFPDPALRGTETGQRQQDLLPEDVTVEIRGRDARFDPEAGRALIPPDVFASPAGPGTIAHEGGHATELALPDRERTFAELSQAFAALSPEERNRFFAAAQEVQGQVGQGTIENRFGVGGPAELFADVTAVLRIRPDAVPPSLRAIVEPGTGTFTTGEVTTPEQQLALSATPGTSPPPQARTEPVPVREPVRAPLPQDAIPTPEQTAIRRGFPDPALKGTEAGANQQRQIEMFHRLIAEGVNQDEAAQRAFSGQATFTRGETVTEAGQLALTRGEDIIGITPPGTTGDVVGQPPAALTALETVVEQGTDPTAALGLQGLESPLGSALPGVAPLKALQESGALSAAGRALGEADIGPRFSPTRVALETAGAAATIVEETLPRGRSFEETGRFVDPFKALVGNEQEIERAQSVLEEAGLTRSTAARVLFDVFNVVPVVGFTKIDDFARLLKTATSAPGKAKPGAITALKESAIIRDIIRQSERGASPLSGSASDSVLSKLREAGKLAPDNWVENARLSGQEFGERAGRATSLRDKLIEQGVPEQEAILKSTAELRGEMPFRGVTGLDFSPQEEAWFWDQILGKVQYAEGVNVADAMQQMMRKITAGESPKDFPPFIWRIFGRAFGEDFTDQLRVVMTERVKAVRVVAEESAAERLAKAPTPKGVTDRTPLPPEFGAEQLPIRRVAGAPEPGPARTPAEAQQFRAEIELEGATKPAGVTPGEVAGEEGAKQAILREAPEATPPLRGGEVEAFPAPGVALEGVQVRQRDTMLDFLSNTVGILKPLLSSADISWFRQIGKSIFRTPGAALTSLRKGVRSLFSQKAAVEWMDALRAEGSTTTGYRQVITTDEGTREIALGTLLEDRYLAVPGTPGFSETAISARPEFFIPVAAQTLPVIRQSGRAFAVGWNTNYQGMMRYWLDKLTKMNRGAMTTKQVDAALSLGQRITGVGKLGNDNAWFVRAMKVLGFAPGYRVSGPEALVTLLSPRTDPLIRRMAAENLLSWAAMGGGLMTAAKYGVGATVVTTLGASQFGRIKFPGTDTFYNIWGTDGVLARSAVQAITQQRVDVKGNISIVGGGEGGPKGYASSFVDAALSYLQSGEAPVIGLFEELRTGETFIGKKLRWNKESVWEVLKNRLPIVTQDFMDILQTDGPLQALFSAPSVVTGTTGVTSYTPTREEFRTITKYNSADKDVVEDILGRDVPQVLDLTPNEERTLLRFLRRDVREWIEDLEDKHGPIPSRISMDQIILKVAGEQGLSRRDTIGALFLQKAKSNTDALNQEWIKFALRNRDRLEDFYPSTYEADYMQAAQQRAEELGLVPVR